METIKDSILDIKCGIVVQQVNNRRRMGAGLAREIAKKWPVVKTNYMKAPCILGHVEIIRVDSSLYVANLYSQDGYGRDGKKYTSYRYFAAALGILDAHLFALGLQDLPVYFPNKIGCGLGGGLFGVIIELVYEQFPNGIWVDNSR